MRDYGKVFSRIWESADFRALSEDGRTLALYLLTCPHGTIAGVFRVPDGYACEDLQWTAERVSQGFANLHEKGFATRCGASMWVWVHKFLEWNPPENPNQRKAAGKVANSVPADCSWKPDFMRVCGPLVGVVPPVIPPQNTNPVGTVGEPLPNQEQKQEQKQKKRKGAKAPLSADLPTWMQSVIDLYHETLPELPGVAVMSAERVQALREFWDWVHTSKRSDGTSRATNEAEALDWTRTYFERAKRNDWLMGRTPRPAEHKHWRPTLEFLLSSKGMQAVIERTEVPA